MTTKLSSISLVAIIIKNGGVQFLKHFRKYVRGGFFLLKELYMKRVEP